MEWVLRSPQIHSTFSNLGFLHADGYHVNENCNVALEAILHNLLTEDKYLHTFRRSISFAQNIKKDIIPLLIHAKDEKTTELLIRILVNLTIPIECLLSVDLFSQSDSGRHTIFEINNLLTSTKVAFTDLRVTRVVIEFLKKNLGSVQKSKLSEEQCANIINCLLLLRNILHIPEHNSSPSPSFNGTTHSAQNQILWNIFSQSIDKVLIKLMTIPDATKWAVTMVQLVALLYKDQNGIALHKLLNIWLEGSLSESSEDNESNTSPDRGSDDSSPILTSDPTSDSSDTGGSGKSNDEPKSVNNRWDITSINKSNGNIDSFQPVNDKEDGKHEKENQSDETMKTLDNDKTASCGSDVFSGRCDRSQPPVKQKKTMISENSDCGYGTQIENQESISTSSNEDDLPAQKPVHHKPHNPKQRINNKARSGSNLQERKRKKIVKRGKANIINVQGLSHKTPTDDDISNVVKEFTVDFLLKGYNSLVHTLYTEILTNFKLEIDTSHFFWLVTYFLKFATQIELDLELVRSVLSYDVLTYLTAEGVNICEQFELAIKLDEYDLKPCMRRLHLAVTAIREFVQAIELYKNISHICKEDYEGLIKLQIKMCENEELRSLLVLLIRYYNPRHHNKQYLQDLVVTNHILLTFLDNMTRSPDYRGSTNMRDHIQQFATPEIMYQYGLLLEDYACNGEFMNDCIFTVMHHVGGELDSLITLFQPMILKTFTSIWKSEFEICDDWSDLIEYVINTFVKKPQSLQSMTRLGIDAESFDDNEMLLNPCTDLAFQNKKENNETEVKNKSGNSVVSNPSKDIWTEVELSSLSWNYMQCNSSQDVVGEIIKLFKDDGVVKSRDSVIKQLYHQNVINKDEFDNFVKGESERNIKSVQANKEIREDEIGKLCEQLSHDGKSRFLHWVQKVLLDTCYAKINLEKKKNTECKLLNFELFKKNSNDYPSMSPVSYHSLLRNQPVPLVSWNCDQATICKDLKFLQLLHKLGFHMPVDSGKIFIRIPYFWSADTLYDVASKIAPIDESKLKFSLSDISDASITPMANTKSDDSIVLFNDFSKDITMTETPDISYQIQKPSHLATMFNFTPMPGTSFNSDSGEVDKHNWLEIVKKSQEYKISLNMGSQSVEDDEDENLDVEMKLPAKENDLMIAPEIVSDPPKCVPSSDGCAAPAKQHLPLYNVTLAESEYYNNSVCETASVASDLTRMYVSDEDEKSDVVVTPVMEENTLKDERSSNNVANVRTGKRPRVEFSPKF